MNFFYVIYFVLLYCILIPSIFHYSYNYVNDFIMCFIKHSTRLHDSHF